MKCGSISLSKIVEKLQLTNLTPDIDLEPFNVSQPEINRPALQLTGYFEHFDTERVQIIGTVEYTYLQYLDQKKKEEIFSQFFSFDFPGLIFCRGYKPEPEIIELAIKNSVPLFTTDKITSSLMAEYIAIVNSAIAPCISIHGVLVDVYGEGLLIMGESGIGKSEAALELIRRGHRLVTDDVVEIRKVGDTRLIGTSPEITRYFIELRGIGIVDVRSMFGIECVKENQPIDLVIKLEDWKKDGDYDRLGLDDERTEILGVNLVCHSLPIRPGRNLAVICEAAAVNHRQKKMGYNAAQELYRRVQANLDKKADKE